MTYLKVKYPTTKGFGFFIGSVASKYYRFRFTIRFGKVEHSFHFWRAK